MPVAILIPLVMIVLLWVVVILPQQRRIRAHRSFVQSLASGDDVVTTSGLFGTITSIDDDVVVLRIAPDVEVTVARLAIGERRPGPDTVDEAPAATESSAPDEPERS